jgi:hypothetical protein
MRFNAVKFIVNLMAQHYFKEKAGWNYPNPL